MATQTPINTSERIDAIDAARGFALLGIALVNIDLFIRPQQQVVLPLDPAVVGIDKWMWLAIRFVAEAKFYALFSLLFGFGFGIQLQRAAAKGIAFGKLYARRMLILLVFGSIHAFLIWAGDILTLYAVLGLLMLLLQNLRQRALLITSAILLCIPMLLSVSYYLSTLSVYEQLQPQLMQQRQQFIASYEQAVTVYSSGDWVAITAQRVRDYIFFLNAIPFFVPTVLGFFLLGYYLSRSTWVRNAAAHRTGWRRVFWLGLLLGTLGNTLYALHKMDSFAAEPSLHGALSAVGILLGSPGYCLAFFAGILLLATSSHGARLKPLQQVGRMALTNYLMQSIMFSTLFYAYGFGLYNQVGVAGGAAIAVVVYCVQLIYSHYYLQHFAQGPIEWLWRRLTYGAADASGS